MSVCLYVCVTMCSCAWQPQVSHVSTVADFPNGEVDHKVIPDEWAVMQVWLWLWLCLLTLVG